MARYEYRCPLGHVTTIEQPMSAPTPATVPCEGAIASIEIAAATFDLDAYAGAPIDGLDAHHCTAEAARIWHSPTVHYKAPGFYSTDVKARQERKRRPNAGDDLPRPHDPAAAAIARSL